MHQRASVLHGREIEADDEGIARVFDRERLTGMGRCRAHGVLTLL
ncbi:tRNA pseudouridine(55) synthase TruB [Microvirga antarctica]